MSSAALDGASTYLNNLLLSRGFLQDGKPIDFSQLASDKINDSTTTRHATTTRAINLVHDLVLRRDRDAEQRAGLAETIRSLRDEESQRLLDFQKLQEKNAQLISELSTSDAQQRNAKAAAKKAQSETKELREQALKLKSTLDQVRAKCISDVRKRDTELDKLRTHLNGLNRGKKDSASGMKIHTLNIHKPQPESSQNRAANNDWTLENETNDFLAAVVNETSTENVALRKIVGDTMIFLKTITGMEEQVESKSLTDPANAKGIPGQYRDRPRPDDLLPVQSLGISMSEVLAHCQTLLRDPSFVPIEEVQARDEEIDKLRSGWEKMADRWKEAVTMMSQWRQKMVEQDTPMEEVQTTFDAEGLSGIAAFGRSVAMRPNGRPVLDPIEEEELTSMLMDHSRMHDQSGISRGKHSQILQDETLPEPDETGTPRQQAIQIHEDDESDLELASKDRAHIIASPARRGIRLEKPHQPLSQENANTKKRKAGHKSESPKKRRSLSSAINPRQAIEQQAPHLNETFSSETTDPLQHGSITSDFSDAEDQQEDPFGPTETAVMVNESKIPRMTVAQKLAAVEAEASEATEVIRRRQALTRDGNRRKSVHISMTGKEESRTKRVAKSTTLSKDPRKSDKVRKARDRRRSTLTPAELGTLMA